MVQIAGTYQHVETTNPELILRAVDQEISDAKVTGLKSTNAKVIVTVDGDNYTISSSIGESWKREMKFTLGEPFEEDVNGKGKATTIAARDGDKLIFKSTSGDNSGERIYEFSDSGVTLIIKAAGGQAKRVYKRV
ncbi:hypothetical protein Trydic_g6460 [Trypoxylus dichotomus]